ncbi:hypothetical protein FSPOR_10099 [Fusarium sporotrichioides]|uniref:ORC1/DEAH AAA+ ATPase domain-containing protein n=1 Tax=Fusarium sporotrichioides TaxID=5514 RepID=A0A395RMB1_FUSSP|nr:hypothetical protein FSPOR_10099 [Fusarium sporotrichioides]
MLSSLRRVFRTKSGLESKTAESPASEPSPNPLNRKRTTYLYSGIHTLHSSEHDEIDIVFVHGLKGDCFKTWKAGGATEPWPKTLLPLELGTARVLTYSYDSTVTGKEDVPSQNRISNHAQNLLAALATLRQDDNTALVMAHERSQQHLQDIVNFTRGILFLGTPHRGSSLAKIGELVSRSYGMIKETNTDIVKVLTQDSEVLARIQDGFLSLIRMRSKDEASMIDITCFYEELPTKRLGLIVPKHSAILPGYAAIAIHRNHAEMTKFSSPDEPGFKHISGELKRWIKRIQQTPRKPQKQAITHCMIPYTYNTDFVGRSEILELLKSQLGCLDTVLQNRGHRRAALYGLGGVGKTQIAIAYSYWLQEVSKDTSIFWIHASSAERFSEAYAKIAKQCNVPGHQDSQFDALTSVRDWLESKESGKWMIVIDNADDMQLFVPQTEETTDNRSLSQFIPDCAHGTILITTRNMQVGSRLTKGKRPIEVGKMDEHESTQLLRRGLQQGDETLGDLLQLSSRLEFLPLALVQAAAFIQENCITVSEYLELLDGSENDVVELLSEEFEVAGRDSDTPRAVAQTWMLSFQQIKRQYPFAGELLSLMSWFDRQAIPLEFLEFYGEEKKRAESNIKMQLVKALGVLKSFCFVRAERGGDYNMHRLVQLVTRTWLTREGTVTMFAREALLAVSEFYPYGAFEEIATCTAYLAHATSALRAQKVESEEDRLLRASLLHRLGGYYLYQGRYAEAEKLQEESVVIRTSLLGEDHAETLVVMADLAATLCDQGRLDEAEALEVRIMETWKRTRGEEYHQTMDAMSNLAVTLSGQGRSSEAEAMNRHVMEVRKRILGEEHLDTLISMNNLSTAMLEQGRHEEAIEMHRHVMEVQKRIQGSEHPDTLLSMGNLARSLFSQGDLGEAEELQKEVTDMSKRKLGEEHPMTLLSMQNLADTWRYMGESCDPDMPIRIEVIGDALALYKECSRLREQVLGPGHAETKEAYTGLAGCQELLDRAIKELNATSTEANSNVVL